MDYVNLAFSNYSTISDSIQRTHSLGTFSGASVYLTDLFWESTPFDDPLTNAYFDRAVSVDGNLIITLKVRSSTEYAKGSFVLFTTTDVINESSGAFVYAKTLTYNNLIYLEIDPINSSIKFGEFNGIEAFIPYPYVGDIVIDIKGTDVVVKLGSQTVITTTIDTPLTGVPVLYCGTYQISPYAGILGLKLSSGEKVQFWKDFNKTYEL